MIQKILHVLLQVVFVMGVGQSVVSAEMSDLGLAFYASPNRTMGDGSISNPWDLLTALQSTLPPGSTLYLRGGTYTGKFISNLRGSVGDPITVRSYPGEWAKIDGYVKTNLSANLTADSSTMTVEDPSLFTVGSVVTIVDQSDESANEVIQVADLAGNVLSVNRGWAGTVPMLHNTGALLVLGGNQLTVDGSDAVYRDFEIMNSDPVRNWGTAVNGQNAPHLRGEGVMHLGARTNLVNLVIHDNQDGIFGSPSSVDSETYGCIVYNNGYTDGNGPAGHGWYIQNNPGSTKAYRRNYSFNNQMFGFQEESVSGNTVNIINDGLVIFNNAALIGASSGIVDNVTFENGFTYNGGLRLGYQAPNGTLSLTNNYLASYGTVLDIKNWSNVTFYGNTVSTKGGSDGTIMVNGSPGQYNWNNNRYYDLTNILNFVGSAQRAEFSYNGSDLLQFSEWKANSGFDSNVADLGSTPPSDPNAYFYTQTTAASKVFVDPNAYEPGRANIIIYNWALSDLIDVDLSGTGLISGQTYVVKDAQNYFGAPILNGIYNSASPRVTIPLIGLSAGQPIGNITPPLPHSC